MNREMGAWGVIDHSGEKKSDEMREPNETQKRHMREEFLRDLGIFLTQGENEKRNVQEVAAMVREWSDQNGRNRFVVLERDTEGSEKEKGVLQAMTVGAFIGVLDSNAPLGDATLDAWRQKHVEK